ncbi:unnamed protein product [Parajaminaea phylloscopi]
MANAAGLHQPWQPQPYHRHDSAPSRRDGDDIGLSYPQQGDYASPPPGQAYDRFEPRGYRSHWEEDHRQMPDSTYPTQWSSQYPPQTSHDPTEADADADASQRLRPAATSAAPAALHPDKPLDWDILTDEQKRIAKTFPEDLDEDGSTMWQSCKKMLTNWRAWIQWRYWYYYLMIIVVALLIAFMTVYHHQIIHWLTPISKKVNSVAWGWVIPVAILFVISFPPLFGHEIVAILCGVVYSLWIAFGIVALGTLLGELGNFWAFKWCFKRLAEKYERKSLNYACMAHIVREGGFLVILIARLSAIPGHFTTAVFATVGMNIFIFTLAALLSMPKQLAVVYLGVAIAQSGDGGETTKSKVIKYVVLAISAIITLAAAWYLYDKMEKARPIVQARLRAKRYALLSQAASGSGQDDGRAGIVLPHDGRRTSSQIDGAASVWSHAGGQAEVKEYDDNRDVYENVYRYEEAAYSRPSYPPNQPRRNDSRSSWTQRLLPGQRSRADAGGARAGEDRHRRSGSNGWPRRGQEDEEAQAGMLSLAAPVATIAAVGSGYGYSTESLAPDVAEEHQAKQPWDRRAHAEASPTPALHFQQPDARHLEQQQSFSRNAAVAAPVEPLDMGVLLAATTRNRSASGRAAEDPGPERLANPYGPGRVSSSPEPLSTDSAPAHGGDRTYRRGAANDYEPRTLDVRPPAAGPSPSSHGYRQATEGGYSLYSLGSSAVEDGSQESPLPLGVGRGDHRQPHPSQYPSPQQQQQQQSSRAGRSDPHHNFAPSGPPSYTSHRF